MTFRRDPPSPPPPTPPSVLLLRAIGDVQMQDDGESITDLDLIEIDMIDIDLWPLIHRGVRAGYLLVDEDDAVSLSPKGWAWYRHDAER